MAPFRYRIVVEWSDEDAAFVARVPALPGCMAHGTTSGEAVREAQQAAEAIVEVMRARGRAIPPEDAAADYSGQLRLRLPRSLHEWLSRQASADDVSLNTLMLTLLSAGKQARPAPTKRPGRVTAKRRRAAG